MVGKIMNVAIQVHFKDQKMSLFEKESTFLLTTFDDQIIWIIGHRADRRFAVTEKTKTIVKFEIK